MGSLWFLDLSGHLTDWTGRHLTGKECFGTQHSQARAQSQGMGECVWCEMISDKLHASVDSDSEVPQHYKALSFGFSDEPSVKGEMSSI